MRPDGKQPGPEKRSDVKIVGMDVPPAIGAILLRIVNAAGMYDADDLKEAYRRLHHAIMEHPHLTGLQSDEMLDYLDAIWRAAPMPQMELHDLTPDFEKELDL